MPTIEEQLAAKQIGETDRRAILAFQRFLREVGNKPMPGVLRDHPGWLPYVLGTGPPPPEGLGGLPLTAWRWPAHDSALEANLCPDCNQPVLLTDPDVTGEDDRGLPIWHRPCAAAAEAYSEAWSEVSDD